MQKNIKKILLTDEFTAPFLAIYNALRVTRYALCETLTVDNFFAILKLINPTMFLSLFLIGFDHG